MNDDRKRTFTIGNSVSCANPLVVGVRSDGSIAVFVVLGAGVTQPERQ